MHAPITHCWRKVYTSIPLSHQELQLVIHSALQILNAVPPAEAAPLIPLAKGPSSPASLGQQFAQHRLWAEQLQETMSAAATAAAARY
jgi:hypothetical protein